MEKLNSVHAVRSSVNADRINIMICSTKLLVSNDAQTRFLCPVVTASDTSVKKGQGMPSNADTIMIMGGASGEGSELPTKIFILRVN